MRASFQRPTRREWENQPHLVVVGNHTADKRQHVTMRRDTRKHIVLIHLCPRIRDLFDDDEPTLKDGLQHLAKVTFADLEQVGDRPSSGAVGVM